MAPCNSGAKGLRLTTTGHVHVEGLTIEAADLKVRGDLTTSGGTRTSLARDAQVQLGSL